MDYKRVQAGFFMTALLLTLAVTIYIFAPYLYAVILALALAVIFKPTYNRVLKLMKKHPSWASFIVVVFVTLIILIPLVLIGLVMVREASQAVAFLNSEQQTFLVLDKVEEVVAVLLPGQEINLAEYLRVFATEIVQFVVKNIGPLFSNVFEIIISFFLTMFGLYYVLRDGSRLKKALISFSPLADKYDKQIYKKLIVAVNSVIKGELTVAILQGLLSGIGFWVFGVPNPVLLGAITVVAALLPAVGVLIVFLPAVLYLALTGGMLPWIGLAVWGGVLVGLIDNLLRPKLIERDINIHPLLIFLSVLGGISVFGAFGFLIGPLVLSLLFALLDIYKEEFKSYLK